MSKPKSFCDLLQAAIEAAPEGVKELLAAIRDEHCQPVVTADSGGHGGNTGDPPGN